MEYFCKIIQWAGGKIEDNRFVVRPGVRMIKNTTLDPSFKSFCSTLNMNTDISPDELSAEFNSRICYTSFPKTPETISQAADYNDKMVNKYGHTSVYNDFYVSFLVAGITDETVKELLAHTEHKASRLTSSKTKCQTTTLYRVQGTPDQMNQQKNYINEFLKLRENSPIETTEFNNICNLGCKAAILVYTMSLKDFRKMITGRLPESGNETEMREVVSYMLVILKQTYTILFENMEPSISVNFPCIPNYSECYLNEEGMKKYAEIVGNNITGFKTVLDIGCGHFEIYNALNLGETDIKYIGWDIVNDQMGKMPSSSKFVYHNGDYKSTFDTWIKSSENPIIVSNPPYNEIPAIMGFIGRYNLPYILMTSDKYLDYFKGARFLGVMNASKHFTPQPTKENHYIMTNV